MAIMKSTKKAKVVKMPREKHSPAEEKIRHQHNRPNQDTQATIRLISNIIADQIKMLREIEFSIQASKRSDH
jgi:hypothetical protein